MEELAAHEDDPDRRRSLEVVRNHLAERDPGAKVSEVAKVLGLSQPTVRAWIESGLLEPIVGTTPVPVDVLSLADVDLIRRHKNDKRLLADVMRLVRDRAALAGKDVSAGLEDLADLAADLFVIDGRYGLSGAQPAEVFARALATVADERRPHSMSSS